MKPLGVSCLLLLALGCAKSGAEHLADARAELADAAYADAIEAARAGLAAAPDEAVAWGLELVRLEANARLGQAESTQQILSQLIAAHPDRVPPAQYAATAHQLKSAGAGVAAIEVLDLGAKRFPADPLIAKLIGDAAAGGGDPAELEMLRSLGYVE